MQILNSILNRESLPVPDFHLDRFQLGILQEMHLEFFFARCRFLITPNFRSLVTGDASREELSELEAVLSQRQSVLGQLKRSLIYSLALHSALLETNSYFIAVNQNLLIARFVGWESAFEVKLYTLRPEDLPARYGDKIYLGRDLLRLEGPGRGHFGLRFLRNSLREQLPKLERRLAAHADAALRADLEREFLGDLRELFDDFSAGADAILSGFPSNVGAPPLEEERLLDCNRRFRELKHVLLEADEVLEEMEDRLFERGSDAARYVTKLHKDVTNDVNYIMLKVNGRISDAINGIRL